MQTDQLQLVFLNPKGHPCIKQMVCYRWPAGGPSALDSKHWEDSMFPFDEQMIARINDPRSGAKLLMHKMLFERMIEVCRAYCVQVGECTAGDTEAYYRHLGHATDRLDKLGEKIFSQGY